MDDRRIERIASKIVAIDFPTQDAYDKYMKEHPDADKSLHKVVETQQEKGREDDSPAPVSGTKWEDIDKKQARILERKFGKSGFALADKFESSGFEAKNVLSEMSSLKLGEQKSVPKALDSIDSSKAYGITKGDFSKVIRGVRAAESYKFDGYERMNGLLRKGKKDDSIESLESLIEYGPKNESEFVYRVFSLPEQRYRQMGIKADSSYSDPAFLSTTTDEDVAQSIFKKGGIGTFPSGNVLIAMDIGGASGFGLNFTKERGSGKEDQSEVLMPPNTKIRIKAVQEQKFKGRTIINILGHIEREQKVAASNKQKEVKTLFGDDVDEVIQRKRLHSPMVFNRIDDKLKKKAGDIEGRILRIAEAVSRLDLSFKRDPEADEDKLNIICKEVNNLVDRIRRNESLESFVNRTDDDENMILEVGLSDHEAIEAIVEEIVDTAEKLAKKHEFEMSKEVRKGATMNRQAVAAELVRIAESLTAIEFPTQDAYDKYMKEHPDADKSNHAVKRTERKEQEKEESESQISGKNLKPEPLSESHKKRSEHQQYVNIKRLLHEGKEDEARKWLKYLENHDDDIRKKWDESVAAGKKPSKSSFESLLSTTPAEIEGTKRALKDWEKRGKPTPKKAASDLLGIAKELVG